MQVTTVNNKAQVIYQRTYMLEEGYKDTQQRKKQGFFELEITLEIWIETRLKRFIQ